MYYAVIFTSTRTEIEAGYAEMAIKMLELAKAQPGLWEWKAPEMK
jgi:hypothetical protein